MGNANAQELVGRFYSLEKVYLNPVESYKWHTIAVANGNSGAKPLLDDLAKEMSREQIAKAKAMVQEMIEKHPKMVRQPN